MKIANQKDLASGLLYMAVGLGFAVGATDFRMGTAAHMGPGYFPFWLGTILTVIGIAIAMGALRRRSKEERIGRWNLKIPVLIIGSAVLFGLLLRPMGLVASIMAVVVVSSLASNEFGWLTTLVNAVVLSLLSVLLFVYGLGLPFPVWPRFIEG